MKHHSQSREAARIQACAREYRRMGYTVIVDPQPTDLPEFLAPFRPDVIAHGPEGSIVAEVKSRASLARSEELAQLARAVHAQAGWRLDLLVTNPRGEASVPDQLDVADFRLLQVRLRAAARLAEDGQVDAATLLAWSAVEGVLREIAEEEGIYLGRRGTSYVTKRLYSLGLLSRDQYVQLEEGLRFRNSLIHGFATRGLQVGTVLDLISLADTLLHR